MPLKAAIQLARTSGWATAQSQKAEYIGCLTRR